MRDNFKKYLTGAILAGLVMAPSAVWAQSDDAAGPDVVDAEEELDEAVEEELESGDAAEKSWSVSATLVNRLYQGMFADPANDDPELDPQNGQAFPASKAFDRWLNLYVLSASYTYQDFSFGAETVWSHWLTPGGGYTEPYEFRFEDVSLSASWSGYTIEPIDTTISASYSLGLPTSDVSQAAGLIVSNSLGATVSRTFLEKLTLSYTLGGSWLPNATPDGRLPANVVDIYRPTETEGTDVRVGGYNTQFGLSNSLSASIPVWDDLRASVGYSISKYWVYGDTTLDDEYTSPYADTTRGTSDVTTATASLSYPIGDYISLSGGIRTRQLPKTSDNSSFRFPWWDTTRATSNRSAFQMSLTGSY